MEPPEPSTGHGWASLVALIAFVAFGWLALAFGSFLVTLAGHVVP